jgi:hypothetical protein
MNKPIAKHPSIFTVNVAKGKYQGFMKRENKYLKTDPIPPPIATNITFLSIIGYH